MHHGHHHHHPTTNGSGPAEAALELARLNHSVVVQGVEERLRIHIRDIKLPLNSSHFSVADLRCKAYVGPQACLNEGPDGRPDKKKLIDVRLELHDGAASVEVDIGAPSPHSPREPWALRVKFYHRPASQLFLQEKVAEVVEAVPRPPSRVQLVPAASGQRPGSAVLEVVRIVPAAAGRALQDEFGCVLIRAVSGGVDAEVVEDLCAGARELGPGALLTDASARALLRGAGMGKADVVQKLLEAGVPPSSEAAREAEKAAVEAEKAARKAEKEADRRNAEKRKRECLSLALMLLERCPSEVASAPLLERALLEKLPALAEMLLTQNPRYLDQLPPGGGAAARKAHAAGAWTVLAALLERGDPMPAPARELLTYALRAGHVQLARACLARNEDLMDMEAALRTCLDHGRVEIVREALEAQWKVRSSQWSESAGPKLLALECGPADEPAECGVCFEPLHRNPGVFLGEQGFRVCAHFCCLDCAEHVQDEAADRLRIWRNRRDGRLPQPPGPVCPLCRAPFTSASRLADPTLDPKNFFKLACVPEERVKGGAYDASIVHDASRLLLTERVALGALCALLPINSIAFAPKLTQELWPAWCAGASPPPQHFDAGASFFGVCSAREDSEAVLTEAEFLRPGGMLAWLSDHLLELKVENQRGNPPRLQDNPSAWFKYFDFDGKLRLTKPELLRGIAKANDIAVLASPKTPARRARSVGVRRLREIVDAIWDETRWANGVPFADFEGRGGLAERLLAALPGDMPGPKRVLSVKQQPLAVEEALAKARHHDLEMREEDVKRARERDEKKRQAALQAPAQNPAGRAHPGGREPQPGRAGAELLLASLLEAAREGTQRAPQLRIQCPFCQAINSAHASAGQRVICGGCRSIFAVPAMPPGSSS